MVRELSEIALDIRRDWNPIGYGAKLYVTAMLTLNSIDDYYGLDSAKSIVSYFLCNSQTWKGEQARKIKLELKRMLK